MDKNQIMIRFLMDCPILQQNPMFFNFAQEEDGTNHFVTISENEGTKTTYIDGSALRQYIFQIVSYKSVAHNPLIDADIINDENIQDLASVKAISDWINEQGENNVFPNFGDGYIIESMRTLTVDPELNGVDTSVNPPIAQYSIAVKIMYLDMTKRVWSNS